MGYLSERLRQHSITTNKATENLNSMIEFCENAGNLEPH